MIGEAITAPALLGLSGIPATPQEEMLEARQFGCGEYDAAIVYLEELAASGIRRVIVEREGLAGWVPWLSGPPSLAVYGLARAQDLTARPRIRIAPSNARPGLRL